MSPGADEWHTRLRRAEAARPSASLALERREREVVWPPEYVRAVGDLSATLARPNEREEG